MTTKEKIQIIIQRAVQKISWPPDVSLEINYPSSINFGHYSCNIAMILARSLKKSPQELAQELKTELLKDQEVLTTFSKVEVAGPGFLNFHLSTRYLEQELLAINKQKAKYGQSKLAKKEKVMIEFISANPTGPLTLANGRGGFCGDVLANVLQRCGYTVSREYYINDAGNQIVTLGKSVLAAAKKIPDDESYYHGEYIKDWLQQRQLKLDNYLNKPEELGQKVAEDIFTQSIKPVISSGMKIAFDRYYSEYQELHQKDQIKKVLTLLKKSGHVYQSEQAWWFASTKFGDDKDRVLLTADERPTYFLVDIAYHLDKAQRGFNNMIDIWGADHAGYVARLKSAVKVIQPQVQLEVIIMQLVRLISGGKEFKMSKRQGTYVTMDYLLKILPLDVVRWFFVMYTANTHFDFNLDLAKDKSEKNPVYYVQYAHARISSIIHKTAKLKINKTS
ncbi:MAG: arginine--tRNA ligase, partial [Candidatus Komeilibacteria bacterium CG_4_9_14_3_um_filter_37_5]